MKTLAAVSALLAAASALPEPIGPVPRDLPLVQSNQLRRVLTRSALLERANKLESIAKANGGTRVFGTKGHNQTVDYIVDTLKATGYYDVELQTFSYLFSEGSSNFSAAGKDYVTEWFTYGPGGDARGRVVVVSDLGCEQANYPAEVSGNIALIQRGSCEFGLKIARAGAAGAVGAIIYNNAEGPVNGGTLAQPSRPEIGPYVPAGSISGTDGRALAAAASAGNVTGRLVSVAVNENRPTSNVLATSKIGDKNNIVFSGGHTDSVAAGPGINDNGSGSMGILEIAVQLSKWKVNNAVRFGFWTAEEFGLVGAEHYVAALSEADSSKIALYLNHDMIASPNFGYFIYDGDGSAFNITGPPGSDHIEHLFEAYFKNDAGITTAPTAFDGRSDYGPFLDVGIPSGGLFTGAEGIKTEQQAQWWGGKASVAYDPNYHQAGDGVQNLNVGAWIQNTKAAAHAVAVYASDLSGIPRGDVKRARFRKTKRRAPRRKHAACNHVLVEV